MMKKGFYKALQDLKQSTMSPDEKVQLVIGTLFFKVSHGQLQECTAIKIMQYLSVTAGGL